MHIQNPRIFKLEELILQRLIYRRGEEWSLRVASEGLGNRSTQFSKIIRGLSLLNVYPSDLIAFHCFGETARKLSSTKIVFYAWIN